MSDFVREARLFRLVSFSPSHRQMILRSDATAVDRTSTRVEVYFGHVELMFLKPIYKGLHIRRASEEEFADLRDRHGIDVKDAAWTWLIEPNGRSFVVSAKPAWREADRKFEEPSLFDFSQPWPPEFPAEWGNVE